MASSQEPGRGSGANSSHTESILKESISDLADERDSLGFEPYVTAIAEFLLNPHTAGPLTVSIEGQWGSGKSSFMMQLRRYLRDNGRVQIGSERSRPLTMWFNAWLHEKDDALWSSFAVKLVKEVGSQIPLWTRATSHLRLLASRFVWSEGWLALTRALVCWVLFIGLMIAIPIVGYFRGPHFLVTVYNMIPNPEKEKDAKSSRGPADGSMTRGAASKPPTEAKPPAEVLAAVPGPVNVAATTTGGLAYLALCLTILMRLRKLFKSPLEFDLRKYLRSPDYASHVSFLEQFHDDFSRLVKAYVGERKLFVFIDDLDRCEVPKAADLMQALNLLVSTEAALIFIIGMDREKVAAGLAAKYERLLPYMLGASPQDGQRTTAWQGLEFGYAFIEKFIQIPFLIPKPGHAELAAYLANLSRERARTPGVLPPAPRSEERRQLREWISLELTGDSPTVRSIVLAVASTLDNNPRRIKQFINMFRLRAFIASETGLLGTPESPRVFTLQQIGKFVALWLRWPMLLDDLKNDPDLLAKLEMAADTSDETSVEPVVLRWLRVDGMATFIGAGWADGVDISDVDQWRFSGVDVRMLLQISPRVRPRSSNTDGPDERQRTQAEPMSSEGRPRRGDDLATPGARGEAEGREDRALPKEGKTRGLFRRVTKRPPPSRSS